MITSANWTAPADYKVYCFQGEPQYILVCVGRENDGHPKFFFFDKDWKLARINKDSIDAPDDFSIDKPSCLEELLQYARKLSKPFPFVRVDFYVDGEKIYFGEMTFTPSGGLDANRLPETDYLMGSLVDLNYDGEEMKKEMEK